MTGLKRWARVEIFLAAACMLAPFIVRVFDDAGAEHFRSSISSYWDMESAVAFYVPLTVAAMLFVVNGVIKKQHHYNWILGVALGGVIALNHDDFTIPHMVFAIAFFLGNAAFIFWLSRTAWRPWRVVVLIVIAAAILLWKPLGVYSLFWAETISLIAIGIHFVLTASGVRYEAAPRGDWKVESLPATPPRTSRGGLYRRADGKWGFRIEAANGQIVATDGGQGYENKADARATLEKVIAGRYDGPIVEETP